MQPYLQGAITLLIGVVFAYATAVARRLDRLEDRERESNARLARLEGKS